MESSDDEQQSESKKRKGVIERSEPTSPLSKRHKQQQQDEEISIEEKEEEGEEEEEQQQLQLQLQQQQQQQQQKAVDTNPYDVTLEPSLFPLVQSNNNMDINKNNKNNDDNNNRDSSTSTCVVMISRTTTVFSTKWNEKFQRYFEMSTKTSWDRLIRARKMNKLYQNFILTATNIGKTIIIEFNTSVSSKTISPISQSRGIAGGEKYCYDGIFFKLGTDPYLLYGGDHFSMKAAGHEIKAFNELLACPVTGLHWPVIAIIDYRGYRLVAEAALPISRNSLKYGSDDGCQTIHDDSEELHEMISQVAEHLSLKSHVAGTGMASEPRELSFPADIEGHLGSDNKFYVVDVQRLFPAEGEFKETYGALIPCDVNKEIERRVINRCRFYEEISALLQGTAYEQHFPEILTVVYTSQGKHDRIQNKRASRMTNSTIYGDAFTVLGESSPSKREVLFYMLRPEWIRHNRPLKVSPDAFTKFGAHHKEEHEQQILELRRRLVEEKIPQFADWLTKNSYIAISPLHIPSLLHENGINLRYVGLLYMLIPYRNSRLKSYVIGFTMLGRVIKDLLQAKLRGVTSTAPNAYERTIVDFYNLVFGESCESDIFWETIPIHLIHKYGPFGFKYDSQKDNFKSLLGHLLLFRLTQEFTAVTFKPSVEVRFFSSRIQMRGKNPLNEDDLRDISPKIKRWRLYLLPLIDEVCFSTTENPCAAQDKATHLKEDEEFYRRLNNKGLSHEQCTAFLHKLQIQRRRFKLTSDIFGGVSPEATSSVFRMAMTLADCGEYQEALTLFCVGLKQIIQAGEIFAELLLSCLFLLGSVLESCGCHEVAHNIYNMVLRDLEKLSSDQRDKYNVAPFELEFHQRLINIAMLRGETEIAELHKQKLYSLGRLFDEPIHEILSATRIVVDNFLVLINLSGVKLNYTQELQGFLHDLMQIRQAMAITTITTTSTYTYPAPTSTTTTTTTATTSAMQLDNNPT